MNQSKREGRKKERKRKKNKRIKEEKSFSFIGNLDLGNLILAAFKK